MGILDGKKILITGVLTDASLAFGVAKLAQEEGAEIILTGAGRGLRLTQRTARKLPSEPAVYEFDVTDPAQPVFVSLLPLTGRAPDVAARGDHAYVTCGDFGVQVVDVTESPPLLVATVDPGGRAGEIEIECLTGTGPKPPLDPARVPGQLMGSALYALGCAQWFYDWVIGFHEEAEHN